VTNAAAATEVEVMVATDPLLFEKVKQGNPEWDSLQQPVLYTRQHKQLFNGRNKIKLYVAPAHIASCIRIVL
jgi:hypothetical protein